MCIRDSIKIPKHAFSEMEMTGHPRKLPPTTPSCDPCFLLLCKICCVSCVNIWLQIVKFYEILKKNTYFTRQISRKLVGLSPRSETWNLVHLLCSGRCIPFFSSSFLPEFPDPCNKNLMEELRGKNANELRSKYCLRMAKVINSYYRLSLNGKKVVNVSNGTIDW